MDDVPDAANRSTARENQMEGWLQQVPVEPAEGSRGQSVGPARRTNGRDQLTKLEQVAGVDERAVAPTADAAQVSASKRHVVSLTICCRRSATDAGHPLDSIPEVHPRQRRQPRGHARNATWGCVVADHG